MTIKVKCIKCEWEGLAEVGKRSGYLKVIDYKCYACGSPVKRGQGSSYEWGWHKDKTRQAKLN